MSTVSKAVLARIYAVGQPIVLVVDAFPIEFVDKMDSLVLAKARDCIENNQVSRDCHYNLANQKHS